MATNRVRKLINESIGSYDELQKINRTQDSTNETRLRRARRLQTAQLEIANVVGEEKQAEDSFVRINDSAAKINKTERHFIKTRASANTIAVRAILRAGTGHRYWSSFKTTQQQAVERKAKKIFDALFKPPYESPVYTTDLPLAGRPFSLTAATLVRDFVNIANGIHGEGSTKKKPGEAPLSAEQTAEKTLAYLDECIRVLDLLNSRENGKSLGIHPTFYVYSADGRLKNGSFYAVVYWVREMDREDLFREFTDVRSKFEEAIAKYDYIIQEIIRHYRGAFKGYQHVAAFYKTLVIKLSTEKNLRGAILATVHSMGIQLSMRPPQKEKKRSNKKIDRNTKSEAFLDIAKRNVIECSLCGGRLHKGTISADHKKRQQEGGLGEKNNTQFMHPFCNTVVKK